MAFVFRCISLGSLKGAARGEGDDETSTTGSGTTTPGDTAHGGKTFSSYSWKRLSGRSGRLSTGPQQPSPRKPYTPPPSASSAEGVAAQRGNMDPVMERTASALTDLEAVKFLVEDWSHKHWRPATPQDQQRFDSLEQSDIKPLVALGEGAYGSVNLCRIPAQRSVGYTRSASLSTRSSPSPAASAAIFGAAGEGAHAASAAAAAGRAPASDGGLDRAAASSAGTRSTAPGVMDAAMPSTTEDAGAASSDPASTSTPTSPPARGASSSSSSSLSAFPPGPAVPLPPEPGPSGSGSVDLISRPTSPQPTPSAFAPAAMVLPPPPAHGAGLPPLASTSGLAHASTANEPQLIVAVKRVPLGWNQERELMQLHRCQQCPFIVRLFGFVEDGTEHCSYVMEWAEGGDLGAMLASLKDRRGANKSRLLMSEASARYYMACLLLALEFLHAHGLLHRDIKPSNLLLTSDGTAKLADLGFTVALDANSQTVGCCGTTGYIAPEVYAYGGPGGRKPYGVPADLWSSGATLYQILTGCVVTDKPGEVLKRGWRAPTHPLFSPALQDLLNRLLAPKPSSRPQSVSSIMRHAWFATFDWQALRQGRMKAPYVPSERRRARQALAAAAASSSAQQQQQPAQAPQRPYPYRPSAGAAAHAAAGPPPASPGGQRLPTVPERPTQPGGRHSPLAPAPEDACEAVVQRSAVSACHEGSTKRGREGLVREGSSFETTLGTITASEAQAANALHADAAGAAAGGSGGASAAVIDSGPGGSGDGGHRRLGVRFALGVAECA